MRDDLLRTVQRYQRTFLAFSAGQKVVALIGTLALLVAAVLVFRWASAPNYSPLFSGLSGADASAVIDELDAKGIPYKITHNGDTVMVPRDDVYKTRISLSGDGLPSASDGGYSILDSQDLSTSQFKEQTDFKRAMEGELSKTVGALDGVSSAVVHLALPTKQVFADKQDPATASVLLATKPGGTLDPGQVQAVVHLVASSIDGLAADKVTVADSTGKLLSGSDGTAGAGASNRNQEVTDFENAMVTRVQNMLDRVVGPGNSSVQVTADLNFDKSVKELRSFKQAAPGLALSSATDSEVYSGPAGGGGTTAGGVVGPDGQMDSTGGATSIGPDGASSYEKKSTRTDNALDSTTERREVAPGGIDALHIGMVIDRAAAASTNPQEIETMVASAIGIDPKRGDTSHLAILPFDRTLETQAAKAIKDEAAASRKDREMTYIRNTVLGVLLLGALVIAWLRGRKRTKQRQEATSYVVEQLREDATARALADERRAAASLSPASALLGLEGGQRTEQDTVNAELAALVESQPDDVAALLRGWLVERQ